MSIRDVIRRLVEERQTDDAAVPPEEPEVRLAIYDSPLTTPRVISLSGEDFETLIGELAAQTYNYSHEPGGRIPRGRAGDRGQSRPGNRRHAVAGPRARLAGERRAAAEFPPRLDLTTKESPPPHRGVRSSRAHHHGKRTRHQPQHRLPRAPGPGTPETGP